MLVPSRESSAETWAVVPLPIVTNAMTAATPMTTPSTVRKERSMFRLIARSASFSVSKNMIRPPAMLDLGLELAVYETQQALSVGSNIGLVRDHDDRDALFAVQSRHQVHDLDAGLRVQI